MDYQHFCKAYPDYSNTSETFDKTRATEYPQLDKEGQVYFDYTGGNLYSKHQIQQHFFFFAGTCFWQSPFNESYLPVIYKICGRNKESCVGLF